MGLFKKKKEENKIPSLPELPKLPELGRMQNSQSNNSPFDNFEDSFEPSRINSPSHKLPSFPSGNEGDSFSKNTIKHAISGRDIEPNEELPEIPESNMEPSRTFPVAENYEEKIIEPPQLKEPKTIKKTISRNIEPEEQKETGPVFIRIDKFEESIKFIKKTKEKISEVEKLLAETKELKEKEEKELMEWEEEMGELKSKIERIERDLTSKV